MPGYFYEYLQDHFKWVDFRYEGVFVFCKKCVLIGHKSARYPLSLEEAHRRFGCRMAEVCLTRQTLLVGHPPSPCFTNKIIGLRRIEILRTSRINLLAPPSDETPFAACFQSSTSQSDSSSSSDRPNKGGCSRLNKRRKPESSIDDENSHRKRPIWARRKLNPIPPIKLRLRRTSNQ